MCEQGSRVGGCLEKSISKFSSEDQWGRKKRKWQWGGVVYRGGSVSVRGVDGFVSVMEDWQSVFLLFGLKSGQRRMTRSRSCSPQGSRLMLTQRIIDMQTNAHQCRPMHTNTDLQTDAGWAAWNEVLNIMELSTKPSVGLWRRAPSFRWP